jgi:hypothetical protein
MATPQPEAPQLLMPKATSIWLIDNTTLTFDQVAQFTGLHKIEVQALADEDVGYGINGRDPVKAGETTQAELDKAIADESYIMKLSRSDLPTVRTRAKGPRYTPVSKRGDKPDAISWILKHHPEISDAQIGKLVGTTKPTIEAIRDRTHQSTATLRPRNPAEMGLCNYKELEAASDKGLRAQGKDPEAIKAERLAKLEEENAPTEESPADTVGGFDFSNFLSSGTANKGD